MRKLIYFLIAFTCLKLNAQKADELTEFKLFKEFQEFQAWKQSGRNSLPLAKTGQTKSRACQPGTIVTVAHSFQSDSAGRVDKTEIGSMVEIKTIQALNGMSLVELDVLEGTGVSPTLNGNNQIIGCKVNNKVKNSYRVCVGKQGYCSATYAPVKLVFQECEISN